MIRPTRTDTDPRGLLARLRRCRRGASAVEFALIAPVFLMFVGGVLEIGRALYIKNSMQYAVEEAARFAMINTSVTEAQVESYAASMVPNLSGIDASAFDATQATEDGVTYMTITGSFNFEVLANIAPIPTVTLTARSKVPLY